MTREELEAHINAFGQLLGEAGYHFVIAAQLGNNPKDCAMLFNGPLTNVVGMCEVMKATIFKTCTMPTPMGGMN